MTARFRSLFWLPILVFLLFYLVVSMIKWRAIEEDIAVRTRSALATAGYNWVKVQNQGRDVLLSGQAPSQADLCCVENLVRKVDGVRTVDTEFITIAPISEKLPQNKFIEKPQEQQEKQEQKPNVTAPSPTAASQLTDSQLCDEHLSIVLQKYTIYFKHNYDEIDEKNHALLNDLSMMLNRCPKTLLQISGHASNVGDREFNQKLSEARAQTVAKYLIDAGIASDRIFKVAYGDQSPVASNTIPQGRAKNRRVEFSIKQ